MWSLITPGTKVRLVLLNRQILYHLYSKGNIKYYQATGQAPLIKRMHPAMSNQSAKSIRPTKQQLIQGLETIKSAWTLTPVNVNEESCRKQWSTEAPLTIKQITLIIPHGRALGYGVRTGAEELLQEKSVGE